MIDVKTYGLLQNLHIFNFNETKMFRDKTVLPMTLYVNIFPHTVSLTLLKLIPPAKAISCCTVMKPFITISHCTVDIKV